MAVDKSVLAQCTHLTQVSPEWARIPRIGQTLEGLFRSQLFALVKKGKIKSAAIKEPGAARAGMRLIHIPSLRKWIESHVDASAEAGTIE